MLAFFSSAEGVLASAVCFGATDVLLTTSDEKFAAPYVDFSAVEVVKITSQVANHSPIDRSLASFEKVIALT